MRELVTFSYRKPIWDRIQCRNVVQQVLADNALTVQVVEVVRQTPQVDTKW